MKHDVAAELPAKAILPILEAPDPRRRVISTLVTTIDDGLRTRIANTFEPMDDAPGIGRAVS